MLCRIRYEVTYNYMPYMSDTDTTLDSEAVPSPLECRWCSWWWHKRHVQFTDTVATGVGPATRATASTRRRSRRLSGLRRGARACIEYTVEYILTVCGITIQLTDSQLRWRTPPN